MTKREKIVRLGSMFFCSRLENINGSWPCYICRNQGINDSGRQDENELSDDEVMQFVFVIIFDWEVGLQNFADLTDGRA